MARTKQSPRTAAKLEKDRETKGRTKQTPRKAASEKCLKMKLEKDREKKGGLCSGAKAMHEVRHYQKTTELLIPKESFQRVIREMCEREDITDIKPIRFESQALLALQEAAEAYLVCCFEDAHLCSMHAKRITIQQKDIRLSLRIRSDQH